VRFHVQRPSAVPLVVCFCPLSKRVLADADCVELLGRAESELIARFADMPGLHVIAGSDLARRYPLAAYHDEYAEQVGAIPYTPAFFTALGTMLRAGFRPCSGRRTRSSYSIATRHSGAACAARMARSALRSIRRTVYCRKSCWRSSAPG